jgi:hypothetical protein
MRKFARRLVGATAAAALATVAIGTFLQSSIAQDAPFGGPDDLAYAKTLWLNLKSNKLAGDGAMHSSFYEGTEPHGFVLEVFDTETKINNHTGRLVLKRNYGPAGVDLIEVSNDPDKYLASITVMFRREAGYDEDNQNWFWAKYLPDGSLDKNPKGMQLAGRVAKGADAGCIACHSGVDDYLFFTDRPD